MTMWLIFGALGLLALVLMVWPLLSRGPVTEEAAANPNDGSMAVLRDQLAEIDRDLARGLLTEDEARDARIEVKRRLLAEASGARAVAPVARRGGWLLMLSVVVVAASGVGLYVRLGAPDVPSIPFADRASERAADAEVARLTEELRTRLEAAPDGGRFDGWMLLGVTYMRMGRYADAAGAFGVAVERPEADSATWSQLAEAMIAAESGVVTPPAEAAIEEAMARDPMNPAAVYYQAIALDQSGRGVGAWDLLVERMRAEGEFAPWMETYVAQVNRIGAQIGREPVAPMTLFADAEGEGAPGPSAEDVAAASEMSEEDRAAFVRSMVERLAARLEDEPEDLDGWLRLANAYRVLGEEDAARAALERAAPLVPETGPARQSYDGLAAELGL